MNPQIKQTQWYGIDISNVNINSLNHRGQPKQSQINIYTDGSKTSNYAGSGIAIIKHGNLRHTESIKLNPNVTIFQAETKEILEAAQWFRLNRLDSENYVCIFDRVAKKLK